MGEYRILFRRSARKEFGDLTKDLKVRVAESVDTLTSNARPPQCRKLKGGKDRYRIRVGDWRVVYDVNDRNREVIVVRIRHRSQAYS